MSVKTFDPRKGFLNVDSNVVTGFAETEKISFSSNEDRNLPHVNIDGDVDRAENANISGVLTVHLKSTSPWVKIFHRMAQSNKLFPVAWEDSNEDAINLSGTDCWIHKIPDIGLNKEIDSVDVEIFIPKPVIQ